MGPLKNVNKPGYYKDLITFWNTMMEHPTYDKFWQDRNLLPHLKKVAPAVMTVGGWFDAEDLYGTFRTYQAIEKQNPGIFNVLVVGPWAHGGLVPRARTPQQAWVTSTSARTRLISFRGTSSCRSSITSSKARGSTNCPRHTSSRPASTNGGSSSTGRRRECRAADVLTSATKNRLSTRRSAGMLARALQFDSFISDPHKPVPTCDRIAFGMPQEYMTDDMRYASRRPDVLTYQTEVLDGDLTLAGPIQAEIYVSTTGTDADWVVKVDPTSSPTHVQVAASGKVMDGYPDARAAAR